MVRITPLTKVSAENSVMMDLGCLDSAALSGGWKSFNGLPGSLHGSGPRTTLRVAKNKQNAGPVKMQ